MKKTVWSNIDSPIGTLGLCARDGALVRIVFGGAEEADCGADEPVLAAAEAQLKEYFAGARKRFDLPLAMEGTEFQKNVWRSLCDIPYGETRSYSDIAAAVGSPRAVRAVGMANHVNPLPIIVPCHRVVGKDGSLTGYAGGLDAKRILMTLERENVRHTCQTCGFIL